VGSRNRDILPERKKILWRKEEKEIEVKRQELWSGSEAFWRNKERDREKKNHSEETEGKKECARRRKIIISIKRQWQREKESFNEGETGKRNIARF
jgi:hypothetical protein